VYLIIYVFVFVDIKYYYMFVRHFEAHLFHMLTLRRHQK